MKNETPEQFAEAMNFATRSIPLSTTAEPNTCGGHYAALTGSPYAGPGPRGLETCPDTETYIQDLHQQLRESRARVAELNDRIIDLENTVNAIADPWDYETGLEKTAESCRAIATDCVSRLNL